MSLIADQNVDTFKQIVREQSGNAEKIAFVYMPNLEYGGLLVAECLAKELSIELINLPITLPVMDIIKQLEYEGIMAKPDLVRVLEESVREKVLYLLEHDNLYNKKNKEG